MKAVQSPGQPWPGGKRCRRRRFPGRKGPHGKGSAPRLMAPYTQQELEALLADLESDLVERKESLHGGLVPLARDARKPIFSLTAGDGALRSHAAAARAAFGDFRTLVENILQRTQAVPAGRQ